MLQPTGLTWAAASISLAVAMVEQLDPAPMKLCRVPEQTCTRSKATECGFRLFSQLQLCCFGCRLGETGTPVGEMVHRIGIRLLPFSWHSLPGWLFLRETEGDTEGQECPGAGKCQLSKTGATGPWLSFKTSSLVMLFHCSILLLL